MSKKDKARRQKRGASGGVLFLIVGAALIASSLPHLEGGVAIGGMICAALGLFALGEAAVEKTFARRNLPRKDVMRLAEKRKGLLTLSEIATALDIDPDVARRTLESLSKAGIARQRWQEVRKNLWEFPDYMVLPISESLELARNQGGRLTLDDLVAGGHTRETARQTLDALEEKGLAAAPPGGEPGTVVVTVQ